jgi:hypothetical protein
MITQTLPRAATHPLPGWGLWAAWIIATTYGTVASLLIFALTPGTSETISLLPRIVIIAMIIGLAQWPVLYRYRPALRPRQWLGANVLGGIAGFFVGWASVDLVSAALYTIASPDGGARPTADLITAAASGAAVGTILALAQWLALRPYLRGAGRWIYAGAAAWAWAGAATIIIQNSLWSPPIPATVQYLKPNQTFVETLSRAMGLPDYIIFIVIVGLASGFLLGAITGLALAALVRARSEATP